MSSCRTTNSDIAFAPFPPAHSSFGPPLLILCYGGTVYLEGNHMDLRNLDPSYDEARDSQQRGGLSLDIGARFYNDGLASDDKRCFEAARQFYEKSLSFGNPQAAVNLGYIYEYGRLGEEDAEQALELFEQAAFCEHPEALYKLGDMLYWRNIDVADESAADIQAFALYGKAHRLAQGRNEPDWLGSSAFRLGGCFEYGRGCARDYALAQAYYVQAAANFEAALDDGFDYYRGNLEKCHRALQRLGERSDSYAQWRPLPSGAKFDVDGILRIDGDSLVPAGCYRARSGEQLIVGQHDVDEGMRVDRRFEVLRCARMVEFNLAMRGSVENRSTVRILSLIHI